MFDISGGQKTLFFKKCPNNGLVSEKKYIEKIFIVGGGVRPKYEKFHTFFFLNEGFPYVGLTFQFYIAHNGKKKVLKNERTIAIKISLHFDILQ